MLLDDDLNIQRMEKNGRSYLDPMLFLFREHAFFDHARLDRYTSQTVETEPDISVIFASCLHDSRSIPGRGFHKT